MSWDDKLICECIQNLCLLSRIVRFSVDWLYVPFWDINHRYDLLLEFVARGGSKIGTLCQSCRVYFFFEILQVDVDQIS